VTQWHPLFAKLLRPLVEGQYEVQTNVPVTTWNVVEYKGPTVSALITHLDLLVELGLGIERRLNEERARQREPLVPRGEMSFWYLAKSLGGRFLRDAQDLLGELEVLADGVWRVRLLQRSLVLVSGRDLEVERDSVPMHLLGKEPLPNTAALAHLLVSQPDLWNLYGSWIAFSHPALMEEIRDMGRAKKTPLHDGYKPFGGLGGDGRDHPAAGRRAYRERDRDRWVARTADAGTTSGFAAPATGILAQWTPKGQVIRPPTRRSTSLNPCRAGTDGSHSRLWPPARFQS
jgi:hypothetical protein